MKENNTDIYCVQETGNHVNKSVNIHNYLLLIHRLPIQEEKYPKGRVGIYLSSNAKNPGRELEILSLS